MDENWEICYLAPKGLKVRPVVKIANRNVPLPVSAFKLFVSMKAKAAAEQKQEESITQWSFQTSSLSRTEGRERSFGLV